MKTSVLRVIIHCLIVLAAVPAYASNQTAAPFTGTMSETWESFPEYTWINEPLGPLSSPTSIMGGNGVITGPAFMAVIRPGVFGSTWGFGSSGYAQVSDGIKALGVDNDPFQPVSIATVTISWSTPILKFGGYFGAPTESTIVSPITEPAILSFTFLDSTGVPLSEESITYSHAPMEYGPPGDGGLDWHGWLFSAPVGSVSITGYQFVMDGLQASVVPEPESLTLLGLGITALTVFRHRGKVEKGA